MELYINGNYLGTVERYWQDREKKKWNFEFESKNGIQKIISVHFSNIKSFTSCGKLEIITEL